MPDIHLARFVIERDPVRDYQIVQREGCQADDLKDDAMGILDVVGQPLMGRTGVLHAWIGPTGPRQAHYVRIVVERLSGGELRYVQWWFSADHLPSRPAHCSKPWPDDIDRIASLAKVAKETAVTRQAPVHPDADPLSYCDGLAEAFGDALGPRITWISQKTDRPIPVDLQFVEDPELDRPKLSNRSLQLSPPTPRHVKSRCIEIPRTARKQPGMRLSASLLLVGLSLGALGGYVFRGVSGYGLAGHKAALPPAGYVAPLPSPKPVPQTADREADAACEALRGELLSSYDAVRKLEQFLRQPGLAKDENQTQIRETVVMTDLLDFGSVDKQKFDNLEVRKLLELFQKLMSLHPSRPDQNQPLPDPGSVSRK